MRTFPILGSFDGRPPLIVGGGELAAVKARLLLKRAASVDVAASGVVPELAALAEQELVSLITTRAPPPSPAPLAFRSTFPTGQGLAPSRFQPSSIAARSRLPLAPPVPHRFLPSGCAPGSSRSSPRASMRLPNSQRSSADPSPTGCPQAHRGGSSGRPCSKAPPRGPWSKARGAE